MSVLAPPMPMAASPAPAPPPLLTAEEFMQKYSHLRYELVRGQLKETPMPSSRHGEVCVKAIRYLDRFVDDRKLGRILSNDSMFLVKRNPDTMRGPDVSFYSFERMPPGPAPDGVTEIVPELAVEIRSPSNSWPDIYTKIGEYLGAGVIAVVVLEPEKRTAAVFRSSGERETYTTDDTLAFPDVLPGFAVETAKLFE